MDYAWDITKEYTENGIKLTGTIKASGVSFESLYDWNEENRCEELMLWKLVESLLGKIHNDDILSTLTCGKDDSGKSVQTQTLTYRPLDISVTVEDNNNEKAFHELLSRAMTQKLEND